VRLKKQKDEKGKDEGEVKKMSWLKRKKTIKEY